MTPNRATLPSYGAASASDRVPGRNSHLEPHDSHLKVPTLKAPATPSRCRDAWPLTRVGPHSPSFPPQPTAPEKPEPKPKYQKRVFFFF